MVVHLLSTYVPTQEKHLQSDRSHVEDARTAMASKKQTPAAEQPRNGELDPIYEWLDDGDSYLLRLSLPGEVPANVHDAA
jgi:hypothetical protein